MNEHEVSDLDIAIIGINCRLPAAKNADEFWQALRDGKNCISTFSEEEMRNAILHSLGDISEETVTRWMNDANYVRAGAALEDIDLFDADFFGYSAAEAELMDPQQRIFLECSWGALEDAGYDPETYKGLIGVYAGAEMSFYHHNLHSIIIPTEKDLRTVFGNEGDYLTTRISYKLNLKGPSINIQSACSTSLVAIHIACQSLKNGECDVALAGGVVAYPTQKIGYFNREGGIFSHDGYCRPFDAKAQGTVLANGGVGIVVLKCLRDAIADGDNIYAVIKGSATNNDGAVKAGYAVPSIAGQARTLSEALAVADVHPESISYIEAHGTATPLGDSIEILALTQAFRSKTEKKLFCAVGSVKSNMGHLGAAAGVIGLIKTVLALKYKTIPPSLHFEQPNPQIDFVNSPFYVNDKCSKWITDALPRRAGVNSFGMGGSNVHVVLEEAPEIKPSPTMRSWQLLILSAKTSSALRAIKANLCSFLQRSPHLSLPDLAFTLQVGRKSFPYRHMIVCRNVAEAITLLEADQGVAGCEEVRERSVVFMFSGEGRQYVNMGLELYNGEASFREQIDKCAYFLKPYLELDLREVLYTSASQVEEANLRLSQIFIAQPALFTVEYALAKLWMKWGITPSAMIGHGIGEYVAACLSGVLSLEDALTLVAVEGRLIQSVSTGAMLAVSLSQMEVQVFLSPSLSLAAHNSTEDCIVSGTTEAIEQLEKHLIEANISYYYLSTSHAIHSQMMDPILQQLAVEARKMSFHPPKIPYISCISGTWITSQEIKDPNYWSRHLRQTIQFADGLKVLLKDGENILLEIGPGQILTTYAKKHPDKSADQVILSSLHPFLGRELVSEPSLLLNACGQLWCSGAVIDWSNFYSDEHRRRISLPTYPFEGRRYWIYPEKQSQQSTTSLTSVKDPDITNWFSVPSWKRSVLLASELSINKSFQSCWLLFVDTIGLGECMVKRLEQAGERVITVRVGEHFSKVQNRVYTLCPQRREDYETLVRELYALNELPTCIAHLWSIVPIEQELSDRMFFEMAQFLGFYSILFLVQNLARQAVVHPLQIAILSNNLQDVIGGEVLCPVRATLLGPAKAIAYEYPNITCRSIDIVVPTLAIEQEKLVDQVLVEMRERSLDQTVAYRGTHRWIQTVESVRLERSPKEKGQVRESGVYLITGGFGGIGFALAKDLAQTKHAKLVLTGRTVLPAREDWKCWLTTHDEQSKIACKIRQVQLLEKLGAEVLPISADITSYEEMQKVISQTYKQFGKLHGVIHAAGLIDVGMTQLKTFEEVANILAPKVKGTLILEAVLKDLHIDFMILCSSLNTVTGGFYVDFCAGNAFLDAFAVYHNTKSKTLTIAINWDVWQEVGMVMDTTMIDLPSIGQFEAQLPDHATEKINHVIANQQVKPYHPLEAIHFKDGMLPNEGVEVFHRVLSQVIAPQIIVSTKNIHSLLKSRKQLLLSGASGHSWRTKRSSVHSRPQIATPFIAPRTILEQQIATIWQTVLGIDKIGVHDNFFEIGGDSLMSMQIISRVYKTCLVEISPRLFFEATTIEGLARAVVRKQMDMIDAKQMNTLLQKVNHMSEEDVALLLGQTYPK